MFTMFDPFSCLGMFDTLYTVNDLPKALSVGAKRYFCYNGC